MSVKRRFMFYNLMMLIFPFVIAIIVYALSTNFFENTFFLRTVNYTKQIENSSEIIEYAHSTNKFELSNLKTFALEKGYQMYILKDGEVVFKNINENDLDILNRINTIQYDVVYHFEGKVTIASLLKYQDGIYEAYYISKDKVTPVISINLLQVLLVVILAIVFITVATSNYIVSGSMIKSFSKPLEKLSKNANKIREGDLSEPVGKPEIKEFDELFQTFELMRKELKSNIDKNIKYEQSRREMLAGISHDLKTPLTVIQGYSKGILDGVAKNDQQAKKYLEVIYRKSIEMEKLLNQLTIFSNLENKTFSFKYEKVNLNHFIESFIHETKKEYLDKKIKISYLNHDVDLIVNIDIFQMQRVLDNIISNSIKYNENSNVEIDFVITKLNKQEVQIQISDNGIGVEEAELERIFENFYRIDESRSTKVEGNGLGLAICKNIVEAHNGIITAKSDNGLSIIITLPIGE